MTRPTWRDVRFVAALPLAIVADLLATWADRVDTRHASAINRAEDET